MNLKKLILKTVSSTVTLSILMGNISAFGIGIKQVIAEDTITPEVGFALENESYVKYQEEENAGVDILSKFTIEAEQTQDSVLPIQSVEVEINLPSINGVLPMTANVIEASTLATTGETNNTNIHTTYESNSGLLTITYESNQLKVANSGEKDIFEIHYHYPAEAYPENEEVSLTYAVNAVMNFKNGNTTAWAQKRETIILEQKENIGSLVNYQMKNLEEKIYKGFLYSNVHNETNYEIDYQTMSTLTVLNSQMTEEVIVEIPESSFLLNNEDSTSILSNGNLIYKAFKIQPTEFNSLLGQEGFIEINNHEEVYATVKYVEIENTNQLAVVYANGQINVMQQDEDTLMVNYPENTEYVTMKISKPIAEGRMHFENDNTIKASNNYGTAVENIKAIETVSVLNGVENKVEIPLTESHTSADLTVSQTNFSVLTPNEITITAVLRTDSMEDRLFDNPVIEMKLPDGIETVTLGEAQLLYGNNTLSIKKVELVRNNTIQIQMEGKQTAYNLNAIQEGASIVVPMTIQFNKTTPMQESKITLTVNNQRETIQKEQTVQLLSKEGLMVLTNLSGYEDNQEVTILNNQQAEVVLKAGENAKTVTLNSTMVNNSGKELKDIVILGKLTENNTIATILKERIQVSKEADIFYAEDDTIQAEDDGWLSTPTDYTKVKAYKIVMNRLAPQEVVDFSYLFNIPADLSYNQSKEMGYTIDYKVEENNIKEQEIVTFTLRTQQAPTVELNVTPNVSLEYIHEGQIVEYFIQVTNKSEMPIENLQIEDVLGNNAIFTEYTSEPFDYDHAQGGFEPKENKDISYTISKLEPNETKTMSIFLKASNIETEQAQLIHTVKANMPLENNEELSTIQSCTSTTEIRKARLEVEIKYMQSSNVIKIGEEVEFYVNIKNISQAEICNLNIRDVLDEDIQFDTQNGIMLFSSLQEEIYAKNITLQEREVNFEIEKIQENEIITAILTGKIVDNSGFLNKALRNRVELTASGIEAHESNTIYYILKNSNISVQMTSPSENTTIENGETITYNIIIKNEGEIAQHFKIQMEFPEEIILEKIQDRQNVAENGDTYIGVIEANETIQITVTGRVDYASDSASKEVCAIAKVTILGSGSDSLKEISSNEIKHTLENNLPEENQDSEDHFTILPEVEEEEDDEEQPSTQPETGSNQPSQGENPDPTNEEEQDTSSETSNEEEKYSMQGTAWLDENKNGQREASETVLSNIRVTVFNASTNKFIKKEDGSDYAVTTTIDGTYRLEGLPKGNYIVMFEYDTNNYTVTAYHKNNVPENTNSDAINKNVTIYGTGKLVALTDTLNLENSNLSDIDIGLMKNPVFDMQLDKQIMKIQVVNSQGTETTDYPEGTDTAKVDLVARYMKTANVVVTYRLTVYNNGEITGYVDSLEDDLPSGLEFSSELNQDWYKGSDGKLHTKVLSGVEILPGESKTVDLILTKNMTEESTGLFSNHAQLEKISNLENITEKEETMANNTSSADLFISIKTGSPILYLGITLSCITMIIAGAYLIQKKVLNQGI